MTSLTQRPDLGNRTALKQGTPEWLEARRGLITAADLALTLLARCRRERGIETRVKEIDDAPRDRLDIAHAAVPPTVSSATRRVGWPLETGTL